MSTQPVQAKEPEIPKQIPELTDAYRKAHKNYVLVVGVFASWELIGITLDTKEKWGIELKSPNAVPLVLFTLLVYSAYKIIIEWCQCQRECRNQAAARFDYWVAHAIGLVAVAIALVQYLSRVQIVDWLIRFNSRLYLFFFVWGVVLVALSDRVISIVKRRHAERFWELWIGVAVAMLMVLLLVITFERLDLFFALGGLAGGIIVSGGLLQISRWLILKFRKNQSGEGN